MLVLLLQGAKHPYSIEPSLSDALVYYQVMKTFKGANEAFIRRHVLPRGRGLLASPASSHHNWLRAWRPRSCAAGALMNSGGVKT